jgi:uncharacterized OB-fold protein
VILLAVQTFSVPFFWRLRHPLYKLEAARCRRCGRVHYPPGAACPYCGFRDLERIELKREGTLESYTVIYSTTSRSRHRAPVILGVINIDGVRIVAELTDVDPEEIKIGTKVEAVLRRIDEDGNTGIIRYAVKFRPVVVSGSGGG